LDGVAAFDYYIRHFNNSRPFFLVGHSQGATILSNLLAGYMKEHPDVYSRMIAAYVIGQPITDEYLARNHHLKFAEGPDDTGVIVSWNTEAPEIGGTPPAFENGSQTRSSRKPDFTIAPVPSPLPASFSQVRP
jgi:hypothetical protein